MASRVSALDHVRRPILTVAASALLVVAAYPRPAWTDPACPGNALRMSCASSLENLTDPSYSTSCRELYGGSAWGEYDIRRGFVAAGGAAGDGGEGGSALMQDLFRVTGLPHGELLSVIVAVRFYGRAVTSSGSFSRGLAEGRIRVGDWGAGGVSLYALPDDYLEVDSTLRLPTNVAAGDTFRIQCEAAGGGAVAGWGWMAGSLSFEGIPAGAAVESCNGFRQESAV